MTNNNLISLAAAKKMTTRYRGEMNNILADAYKNQTILAICETFDRQGFDALLAQEGCEAVRIYYGMSDDLKIHAIAVGVNKHNEDILPSQAATSAQDDDPNDVILEEATRCPDDCPPDSPLNP